MTRVANRPVAAAVVRAELRRRWRVWLLLGLVTGVVAGTALAAVAGVRRTATSFDRMVAASRAADLTVDADAEVFDAVRSLPGVGDVSRFTGVGGVVPVIDSRLTPLTSDATIVLADRDVLRDLGGAVVVEGRAPRPDRHEVLVNASWVDAFGIGVGDEVPLVSFQELADAHALPESFEDLAAAFEEDPTIGRSVVATVVGRFVRYVDFVRDEASRPAYLVLDQATAAELSGVPVEEADQLFQGGMILSLHYEAGADPADVVERIRALPTNPTAFTELRDVRRSVAEAVRPYLVALAAFAGVTALAGFTVIGAALARQASTDAAGDWLLSSLGAERSMLRVIRIGRAALTAAVALVVGTGIAVLSSPLFPVGPVDDAEIHPGVAVDLTVLVAGLVVTLVFVVAVGVAGARLAPGRALRPTTRPHVAAAARALPLPVALGAGLAFPGRGRTRVVMRSAFVALAAAVLTGSAVGSFSAGVARLLRHPPDYGWTWDAAVTCNQGYCELPPVGVAEEFEQTRVVDAWTFTNFSRVQLGGRSVPTVAFGFARGDLVPASIVAGRAPVAAGEIALGASVMDRLDVDVGDEITTDGAERAHLQVVGTAVFPGIGLADEPRASLGDGALLTYVGLREIRPGFDALPQAAILAGPGEGGEVADLLQSLFGDFTVLHDERPGAVESWSALRSLPLVLGAVIGVLAVGTLAHALALSIRLRREELGALVALGLTVTQLRRALHWQAAALVAASVLVGLPLGVLAGRVAWHVVTSRLGLRLDEPLAVTPLALVVVVAAIGAAAVAIAVGRSIGTATSTRSRSE